MVKFSNPQEMPSLSGPARLSSMDNNPHGSIPNSECMLQPKVFSDTTCVDRVALTERALTDLWKKTADSEESTKFLKNLKKEGVGTGEMEVLVLKQLKMKKAGEDRYKRSKNYYHHKYIYFWGNINYRPGGQKRTGCTTWE